MTRNKVWRTWGRTELCKYPGRSRLCICWSFPPTLGHLFTKEGRQGPVFPELLENISKSLPKPVNSLVIEYYYQLSLFLKCNQKGRTNKIKEEEVKIIVKFLWQYFYKTTVLTVMNDFLIHTSHSLSVVLPTENPKSGLLDLLLLTMKDSTSYLSTQNLPVFGS